VIQHPAYQVDSWCLRQTGLDLDVLAQSESRFALSNGHIGWRGDLDEGEPYGLAWPSRPQRGSRRGPLIPQPPRSPRR
jgi:hypothetical protein